MTAALRTQQQGLPVNSDERKTVATFLADWLETVVKPSKRPKTYSSYAQIVRLHIAPDLGKFAVAKLTAHDVQKFMNAKSNDVITREVRRLQPVGKGPRGAVKYEAKLVKIEARLSPRTVSYIREVLRNALGQAKRWDLVPRNVAEAVSPPASVRHSMVSLTPEDAGKLLKEAKGNRCEAMFTVALAVGLRIGEALGLRWSDVDT